MSRRIWSAALLVPLIAVVLRSDRAVGQKPESESSAPAQTSAQPSTPNPAEPSTQPPAQTSTQTPRPPRQNRRPSLDDRVKRLAKALDLNESQQAGVKAVLEGQQRRARQIQFDESISGADRIGKFRALQEDTVSRIRALLNDEQKKKYDPLNHEHQANPPPPSVEDWMKAMQHKQ